MYNSLGASFHQSGVDEVKKIHFFLFIREKNVTPCWFCLRTSTYSHTLRGPTVKLQIIWREKSKRNQQTNSYNSNNNCSKIDKTGARTKRTDIRVILKIKSVFHGMKFFRFGFSKLELSVLKMMHCVDILLNIMNKGFGCGCIQYDVDREKSLLPVQLKQRIVVQFIHFCLHYFCHCR